MDPFEKLVEQETDTDEKHKAAAEFFLGLKTAAPLKVKHQKGSKPTSVSTVSRDKIRKLLELRGSGVKPTTVKVKPVGKSVDSLPGQASTPAGRITRPVKPMRQKKIPETKIKKIPGLKKKASSEVLEDTSSMEKEAFFPITGAIRAGRAAVSGAGRVGARAGAVGAGAKEALKPDISRSGLIFDALKQRAAKSAPNLTRWGKSVGKKYRGVKTKYQNFMDPNLARARKNSQSFVDDYVASAGPKPTKPGPELDEWVKGYGRATKRKADYMAGFDKTRKANDITGFKSTGREIYGAIKGPGGKISPSSIYSGLEGLGLTSPEAAMGMGAAAYGGLKASKAARDAAKAHNQMMMLGGGAAGIGALALLKNKKREQQSIPVHMVR